MNVLVSPIAALLAAAASLFPFTAPAAEPAQLLSRYSAQAGAAPSPERGRELFTSRHGRDWSCATCHGVPPTQPGRHASTGRTIAPMAPAFNPQRFIDPV